MPPTANTPPAEHTAAIPPVHTLLTRRAGWLIQLGVLALYALLSLLVAWPLARDFTSRIVTSGGDDTRLNIWVLWHTQQALLGRQPLFHAPLLYYPLGTSMWTQSPGPLTGLFALPFWPFGAEAAYNGALLISLTLTGYCMYLLARDLGFDHPIAFFAGVTLLTAPICLGGLYQHIDKVFLGLLPLALLAGRRALTPTRSPWWTVAVGFILLLTLLHAGWHFVLAGLSIACLAAVRLGQAAADLMVNRGRPLSRAGWQALTRRLALLGVAVVLLAGPVLWPSVTAATTLEAGSARNLQSREHQPDLFNFFLPSEFHALFSGQSAAFAQAHKIDIEDIEMATFLRWTVVALCLLGLGSRSPSAYRWFALALLCAVLALGPNLKLLGRAQFTEYSLPIILPYAFLTGLPGLGFMRTPGRFMMLGFVGLGIAASYGLAWLTQRFPARRLLLVGGAMVLVLVESWPRPWPQETLRPMPDFYRQIATDGEVYGVFDLPMKLRSSASEVGLSSFYQIYQMTHGKGIAVGFLSYTYPQHPLFPCFFAADPTPPDILVNNRKVSCHSNAQYELSRAGYRYVVQHKPQPVYSDYKPGSQGDKLSRQFVQTAFPQARPMVDDDLVTVYPIPATVEPTTLSLAMETRDGWDEREDAWRWARSPASLYIVSPQAQPATLEITPEALHDPAGPGGVGTRGRLRVQTDQGEVMVELETGRLSQVPLTLVPGSQTVRLALETGNFRPLDYGEADPRTLSFSIRVINLKTAGD